MMKNTLLKRKHSFAALVMSVFLLLSAVIPVSEADETVNIASLYKSRDVESAWDAAAAETIDLSSVTDSQLILSAEGDYVLTGSLQGQILIDAPEDARVRLILNNVSIASSSGPAIYEKQADQLIVTLEEHSVNTLTASSAITDGDDTIGAALYAEDDLSINGSGSLTAESTVSHGIQSKADMIIADGVITVHSALDGIRGRNSVLVLDGTLNITARGDGIAATRTDKEGKGWVIIAGGSITVKTGDGAGSVQTASGKDFGRDGFGGMGRNDRSQSSDADSSISQKAVKAATDLTVLGGCFSFDTTDDGLHAVNVTVSGGTFTILTGDDGMHADDQLTVSGGTIDIRQCYEGMEGTNVSVSGGEIAITASDDAINASGGNDRSGRNGWGFSAQDDFTSASGLLSISGGTLNITAGGDALDSNGSISISGGITGIWCATTRGEGAIDYNGSGTITGGILLVASTGGVQQSLTGQPVMALSASYQANTEIILTDGSGKTLASYTPGKAFDTLMVSAQELKEGDACTVLCNGAEAFTGSMKAGGSTYTSGMDLGGGFGMDRGGDRHGRRGR